MKVINYIILIKIEKIKRIYINFWNVWMIYRMILIKLEVIILLCNYILLNNYKLFLIIYRYSNLCIYVQSMFSINLKILVIRL